MSYAGALDKAKRLKAVMLKYGVPEVSIELQTGRPNPYDPWDGLFVVADMSHHIVSNYNPSNLTPLLKLVKTGRTSVPGPLSNGYGGWDLCYRILCFSYANHPGAGGPRTVPRVGGGSYTIPKDSARRYVWGTEYEGGIIAADWDRLLRNPRNGKRMTMREFMGRAGAAIHDHFNSHSDSHMEHSTWAPDRKIDRLRYNASEGKAEEKQYATAPPPPEGEEDMPLNDADKKWLADQMMATVKTFFGGRSEIEYNGVKYTRDAAQELFGKFAGTALNEVRYRVLPALGASDFDIDALATMIAAKLPTGPGSIDLETVKKGVRAVLTEGVGDASA